MARYWVTLWETSADGLDDDEAKKSEAVTQRILKEIEGSEYSESSDTSLVFKTEDLDEARAARTSAVKIIIEAGYDEAITDGIDIVQQPQCMNCGRLARFSERFCSKCGEALEGGGPVDEL